MGVVRQHARMFAEQIWQPGDMHTDLLADRVKARREQLGLSQEDIAERGGPSTTTLTKIEAGTFKSLRRRTMADLDRALGWRVDSTERLLYAGVEPVLVRAPEPDRAPMSGEPIVEPPLVPEGSSDREWFVSQGATDAHGQHLVIGSLATTDAEGVRSVIEVRYWPGDDTRRVSMAAFPSAVVEARRAALEATNIYREPKDGSHAQPDPAPSTRAGGSPAPDVSVGDYTLAALDDETLEAEIEGHEEQP